MARMNTAKEAERVYGRLIESYEAVSIQLDPHDYETLAVAARHIARAEALDRLADREGQTVPWGLGGRPILHPAIPEARQARTEATKALKLISVDVAGAEALSPAQQNDQQRRAALIRHHGKSGSRG
ncbi:hypothetical protein [Streptomyces sp. G1]|uniref:hypothetical protein n=1 Tax=Streptomyces sp. G1 TaxID=361572 RepID=UPI00202E6221|nr:hypothetical protein [Streptomyces sp. G1]MCM1967244.1 hypothetical protein [Streptomyces sp. G1]